MAATPWVLLAEKTWHSPILILGVHRFLVCQQSACLGRNVADPGVGGERERWDSWISVLPPAASSHGMSTRTALWGQERCQQQSQGASKSQEHSESDGWSVFILPKQWLPLESLLHSSPDSGHMELWHLLAAIILPQMWLGTLEPDLDFLSQRLNLNSVFLRAKKKNNNAWGCYFLSYDWKMLARWVPTWEGSGNVIKKTYLPWHLPLA